MGTFTALAALAALGTPQVDADRLQRQIEDTYDGYARAVLSKDIGRVSQFLTDDVVWIDSRGHKQHRKEILAGFPAWFKSIRPGTVLHSEIEKFVVDSSTKVEAYINFTSVDPLTKLNAKPKFKNMWHDTWVLDGGRWRNQVGVQKIVKA